MLTPAEVRLHCPLLRTEDLQGGLWIPSDVTASPLKLTRTLADIAQQKGGVNCDGVVRCVCGIGSDHVERCGGLR